MRAVWDLPDFDDHEHVHMFTDRATGLKAIISVHSTHLGPAAGGTRYWTYADRQTAVTDALRLSRGMSYKNAMAGLPLGGGKAVILADDKSPKTPEYLAAFGRSVNLLGGSYVTAEDVGMSVDDMVAISKQTKFISGLPVEGGEAGGDPGPFTAYGVYLGIKAAARQAFGSDDMAGRHVALQGVGSVGGNVAKRLAVEGAKLTLADFNADKAKALAAELGAEIADKDAIMTVAADIFSPNALGAILTAESVAALQAPVIAGAANNQLATASVGQLVHDRGIVYAPDYVINAGGIINVGLEYLGQGNSAEVNSRIDLIPGRLAEIWAASKAQNRPASEVADAMAQKLIGR